MVTKVGFWRAKRRRKTERLHSALVPTLVCVSLYAASCTAPESKESGRAIDDPVASTTSEPCEAVRSDVPRGNARDLRAKSERIIGGEKAADGAWPWAAALMNAKGEQHCGAALIAPDWLLTAAHCKARPGDAVLLGRKNLELDGGEEHVVDDVLVHGEYDPGTHENDIALVKLARRSKHTPIDLVDRGETYAAPGVRAFVIGWGYVSEEEPWAEILQQGRTPIVENSECSAEYAGSVITDSMICAGEASGTPVFCTGDSGGPLMVPVSGGTSWQQVGVASFTYGCGIDSPYGMHTRVSHYLDWIRSCRADPPG